MLGYGITFGESIWKSSVGVSNPFIIIFTICGVVLLDFNCDACQSPARAFLIDVSNQADHSVGLSMFTLMAGAGGTLGYCLGGIPWDKIQPDNQLNNLNITQNIYSLERYHQRNLFTFVAIIYAVCTLICVSSFKEIPLNHVEKLADYESLSDSNDDEVNNNHLHSSFESITPINKALVDVEPERPQLCAEIKTHLYSLVHMPMYLRWLCLTHCFSWMSLLCFSLYFTDFVGEVIYGGDPVQHLDFAKHQTYTQGVRIGSICMALYSISCSFYSFYLRKSINRFGIRFIPTRIEFEIDRL